jgi:hypothetical protein
MLTYAAKYKRLRSPAPGIRGICNATTSSTKDEARLNNVLFRPNCSGIELDFPDDDSVLLNGRRYATLQ